MKKRYCGKIALLSFIAILLNLQNLEAQCDCTEYLYLNEFTINTTLKFEINADGSLTQIGNPWAENITEQPHGVGTDINGYLYIGNITETPATAGVDKYDCKGNLVEEDFLPPAPGDGTYGSSGYSTNFYSTGNTLYINNWFGSGYPEVPIIFAYDLCTKELLGQYTVCDVTPSFSTVWTHNWDFYVDEDANQIVINAPAGIAIGDLDTDLNSGSCIPITITTDNYERGIVTDGTNYFLRNGCSLGKYDSAGNLLCSTSLQTGGCQAYGMVYSETTGLLYLSGNDADCIAVYDTNCNYVSQGWPNDPNAFSKAIALVKECCPTPSTQVVDRVFCENMGSESLYLNDLFPCDGIVCESMWEPVDATSQSIFNDCDQTVSANIAPGCYSFTKNSDDTNSQCGAFSLTYNLEILTEPTITVSADQTVCNGDIPAELSVTTTATGFQWQMSTTSCTDGFADIAGATSATYTPNAVTQETYYRVMVTETAGCSDGTCSFESACITVAVEDCPCVPPTAPVIEVTDNVCPSTTGSFAITIDCGTGSSIEWSTDGGANWSATMPTWSDGVSVVARCVDDTDPTCFSPNSNSVTASLQECTPPSTYDVSLEKTVDLSQVALGDPVVFTITVTNNGDAVTGATVNDVLPTGLTYNNVYTASTGTYDGTNWTIGNMAAGQIESIQITATVNAEQGKK